MSRLTGGRCASGWWGRARTWWWCTVCRARGVGGRRLWRGLRSRSRLHLVELPRLGRLRAGEMAPWLGRLLDAVGLGRVDVLAHSLGGLVATELAMEQPDRVRRLVLVAPAGVPCGRGVLGRTLPLLEELYDVRTWLPTIIGDAVRTGPVSLVHGVVYVWERDIRAELGAVRAPTLLVWGDRDRLVPARVAEEWQRLLPRSRLVRLPCGHVPMWEAPRELASCVLALPRRSAPGRFRRAGGDACRGSRAARRGRRRGGRAVAVRRPARPTLG